MSDYYIEYDGNCYWIWKRKFLGYDDCMGKFYSEDEAKKKVDKLKTDPPRIIEV